MVLLWVLLCIIFPPLIPFVIVGALVCLCTKERGK